MVDKRRVLGVVLLALAAALAALHFALPRGTRFQEFEEPALLGKTAEQVIGQLGQPDWDSRGSKDGDGFVLAYFRTAWGLKTQFAIEFEKGIVVRVRVNSR